MPLTLDNIEGEFLRRFPDVAAAVREDAGMDPAGRVDWVLRHYVMPNAIDNRDALREVFDWIERLMQSQDPLVEYWRDVRLLGRTLASPEWTAIAEAYEGPLLAGHWGR
ncbi:hypothetical protein N802_11020 [Knoellia sinensis KCTC 19936]|uniref:Uncharacterized protein n=1 Tax=Knoellia sinensis KCTC 19936 TaxID=1385520 RepID=A0A0A0J802_9MICO|nr:hypothetical protein [Knoellia sinensis]KGN32182.1 hypothetical protein N802_11020 [Knoellia sinensis KCTC 19936]